MHYLSEGIWMVKGAITAPLYISVAWSLIVSYQLFTQTAVNSIVYALNNHWFSVGQLLTTRVDTIVFIHAFAWIFVLSSVIPSVILGRSRSVLLQFFLCLTLTFVATSVKDVLQFSVGANPALQLESFASLFQNPILAGLYLSVPYVFMLYLDIRTRRADRKEETEEETEKSEAVEVEEVLIDDYDEEEAIFIEEIEETVQNV
jgi:hypothetical protein